MCRQSRVYGIRVDSGFARAIAERHRFDPQKCALLPALQLKSFNNRLKNWSSKDATGGS